MAQLPLSQKPNGRGVGFSQPCRSLPLQAALKGEDALNPWGPQRKPSQHRGEHWLVRARISRQRAQLEPWSQIKSKENYKQPTTETYKKN